MSRKSSSRWWLPAAILVFAAGLWLGAGGMPRTEFSAKNPATVLNTEAGTAAQRAGALPPSPAERERERALLDLLAPDGSRVFSGEELARLCVADGGKAASTYAAQWAKRDPAGMHAWFMKRDGTFSLPSSSPWNSAAGFSHILFEEWTKKDAEEALRHALALERREPKQDAVSAILRVLLKRDYQKAVAVLGENAELLAAPGGGRVVSIWNGMSHEENLRLLRTLPAGTARGKLMAGYLINMVHYDGPAAEQAWKEAGPEQRREMILGGFSYSPKALREHAENMQKPVSEVNLGNFEALQREVAESGEAPEVAEKLLEDREKEWAQRDLAEAVQWALTHLEGRTRKGKAGALFRHVTVENFETAETVWRELPDGPLKTHALTMLQIALMNAPEEIKQRVRALPEELPEVEARRFRESGY